MRDDRLVERLQMLRTQTELLHKHVVAAEQQADAGLFGYSAQRIFESEARRRVMRILTDIDKVPTVNEDPPA